MNHGNSYEGFTTGGRPLVVLGQPPAAVEPAEGPFHDPAFWLHYEADLTHQLLDYHSQPTPAHPGMTQGRVEVAVAPDLLQPLDRPTQLLHQRDTADTVLHRGRHHHQCPQQAETVNRHKPLAPDYFFFPHRSHADRPVRWSSLTGYRGSLPWAWASCRPPGEPWSAGRRGFAPRCRPCARDGSSKRQCGRVASREARHARRSRCEFGTG